MSKDDSDSNLIRLNLIYDYPVDWSKFKVLRDLIQNFYDSLGYKQWQENFFYTVKNEVLEMTSRKISFSYDWLLHIGASTKRDQEGEYAGYFGEGFKIASLCALRDFDWQIEMYSKDWRLKVVTDDILVDGKKLKSLAYRVWKMGTPSNNTHLKLYPFKTQDYNILEAAMQSFFYPENPLFGKKIWSSPSGAVYYRSDLPKPTGYPETFFYPGQGIIFAGYQAMGSFPYPLIFCLHSYRPQGRERESFYRMDVVENIAEIVEKLPAQPASEILEVLKSLWYDYPEQKYDFESWYEIIKTLTSRAAESETVIKKWQKKYPLLLVAMQIKRSDIPARNKRTQALEWLAEKKQKYRLVQDGFLNLGYQTLEDMCEKAGGYSITSDPEGIEIELIPFLEKAASLLLKPIFGKYNLPPCKIIRSKNSAWKGMANLLPLNNPLETPSGIKIRYRLSYIALKDSLFVYDGFITAFSTYLHEVSHCFGGDRSANFTNALSILLDIVLINAHAIQAFSLAWNKKFQDYQHEKEIK